MEYGNGPRATPTVHDGLVYTLGTMGHLVCLDAQTGQVRWNKDPERDLKVKMPRYGVSATPLIEGDVVIISAGAKPNGTAIAFDRKTGAERWRALADRPAYSSPIVVEMAGKRQVIVWTGDNVNSLDPATGDEIWRTRAATSERFGMAHIITNGDRAFLLNQQGHLILARLTPAGYHEAGRMPLVEPTAGYRPAGAVCWAHPAFANKHVYARNDRELVCVSLSADAVAADLTAESTRIKSTILPESSDADVNQTLSVTVSPDGKTVAMGTGWGLVRQVDLSTGIQVPSIKRHNDWVCAVTYSSDGKYLVSAGGSEFMPERNGGKTSAQIKVWDRAAGTERGNLEGHTNKIFAAAFSPDGRTLATGSADQTVRLWDIEALQERLVLKGHTDAIASLSWSSDGRTLASASWDKTVKLWDTSSGAELATLSSSDEEILAVAVSPNGKCVAAGGSDWKVRLWEVESKKPSAVLSGHRGIVYAVAYSPDGKILATGSGDETIRFWDIDSQRSTETLKGHNSGVAAIAFSPDSRFLVSGALDGPVRVWNLVR